MPKISTAADALAETVLDHLLTTGCAAVSLRSIGAGVGVSHSLLIYHFGSLTGLLCEVHTACESRQRSTFTEIELTTSKPAQVMRLMWRQAARPQMWALYRLSFELRARTDVHTLDNVAERTAWLEALAPLIRKSGAHSDHVADEALLWLATCRGLLWELVCGADPAQVDRAAEVFFSRYDAPTRPRHAPARSRLKATTIADS